MAVSVLHGSLKKIMIFFALLFLCSQNSGCTDPYSGSKRPNQPPKVWLSGAPPEGTKSRYSVHLFWGGWDPDGNVEYYQYSITDNDSGIFNPSDTTGPDKWHRVSSNDSVFVFSADLPADSSTKKMISEFVRSHTFFIRAVDEEGMASRYPAYRSFTAVTLSPTIDVLIPRYNGFNPALLPPIATFRWEARDYVNSVMETQEPDSVRWILVSTKKHDDSYEETIEYIRRTPNAREWYPWVHYQAPGDTGRFWTSPPLAFGTYIFAMQAKDEAGAVTPVFDEARNVRRVLVSRRTAGPLLTLRNQYIGAIQTSSENTPLTILALPAGVSMSFAWSAEAEHYGGIISGYRYDWDVLDIDKWDTDYTPFLANTVRSTPRTFFEGTHTFYAEVIDNSGFKSRIGVRINYYPFTMQRDVLLVDDYYEGSLSCGLVSTGGAMPCDDEHDAFWIDALKHVANFNPESDILEVRGGNLFPVDKMVQYRTIIWDTYGGYNCAATRLPLLYDLVKFRSQNPRLAGSVQGRIQPNLLALFLAAGGHLLICGEQPMTMTINRSYFVGFNFPFIFRYELEGDQSGDYYDQAEDPVGEESFPYRHYCLNVLDIAYTSYNLLRDSQRQGCGVNKHRDVRPAEEGLRECIPLDPAFPPLTLREEVGAPGKHFAPISRGLNSELYNPPYFSFCDWAELTGSRTCLEPIYGHGCIDTLASIYNAPVAVWTSTFALVKPQVPGGIAARSAVWGFEPFFLDTTAVRQALEVILFEEWKLERK